MTNNKPLNPLPENKSDEETANNVADFSIEKIQKVRDQFTNEEEFKP